MHALRRIHHSLRPGGVLLDLHPQPENSAVEIWRDGQVERLGYLEEEEDRLEILDARARLNQVEKEGWFVAERRRYFDLIGQFPSLEEWSEFQALEGYTSGITAELAFAVRRRLAAGNSQLIIREPIRASLLKPVSRWGNDED